MRASLRVAAGGDEVTDDKNEAIDLALSLAAQLPSDPAQKQQACVLLNDAINWIGDGADAGVRRTAMALAIQMPSDPIQASRVSGIMSSIILAIFGGGAV